VFVLYVIFCFDLPLDIKLVKKMTSILENRKAWYFSNRIGSRAICIFEDEHARNNGRKLWEYSVMMR
jgi:hypothetical protein